MVNVEKMSDAELRAELLTRGVNVGPVTGTTRSLFEKKLQKLLNDKTGTPAKSKTPSKSAPAKSTPAKPTSKASKSPSVSRKSIGSNSLSNTTIEVQKPRRSLVSSKSEEEEESDEDEFENDDEIISPKANTTRNTAIPTRPVSSTPNKNVSRAVKETKKSANDTSMYSSVVIPNLITDFEPSFSVSDRPGATPPRVKGSRTLGVSSIRQSAVKPNSATRTSVTASSLISSPRNSFKSSSVLTKPFINTIGNLGDTTGEEDNEEDDDGLETSRVVFSSKENKRGLVGRAWDKVLGYDFKASRIPGQSYDFRTGATRTKVVRDPKTNRFVIKQSTVFGEALNIALYVLIILFVVLTIGYFLSTSDKPKVASSIAVITKAIRDTVNFFYRYAIVPVLSAFGIGLLGVGAYFGHKKYKEAKEKEELEFFNLIEKIINLVREATIEGEPYVSQPHVRDVIFPPAKRRGAELKRWEKAVSFIDVNESRVATEIRVLPSGNECAVWKWIGNTQQKKHF